MTFDELPVVAKTRICQEARVSINRGNRVLERLRAEGQIKTPPSPTGRDFFTVSEGRAFCEALIQK
jgi:predicted transcriptional regulator